MRRFLFLVVLCFFVFINVGAQEKNEGSSIKGKGTTTIEGKTMRCIRDESVEPSFIRREDVIVIPRVMLSY